MTTASAEAGPSKPSPSRGRETSPASESDLSVYTDPGTPSDDIDESMETDYDSDSDTIKAQVPSSKNRDAKGKGIAGARQPSRAREPLTSSWADIDLSIIVACVSPVGNWLTGGDHIKNLFLIILLIFYLHQLIVVPWNLYQASRPKKPASLHRGHNKHDQAAILAATELHRQELLFLFLTVLSPLLGATFLHHVLDALGGAESLSWFSTTLFVLATGIRPWSHLIARLGDRTHALHDAVHYPPPADAPDSDLARVTRRLSALEAEMKALAARIAYSAQLQDICDDLSEAVGALERDAKRNERRVDTARLALAARIAMLEKGMLLLEQNRRVDLDVFKAARAQHTPFYLTAYDCARDLAALGLAVILRLPQTVWALGAPDAPPRRTANGASNGHAHHGGILKNATAHANGDGPTGTPIPSPRLPTIPESPHSDADSEGTYFSEKEKDAGASPTSDKTSTTPGKTEKARRVRGRSRSTSAGLKDKRGATEHGHWAFERVQNVALWPYRASVRILLALVPPLRKVILS